MIRLWERFKNCISEERFQNQVGMVSEIPSSDISSCEKFLCLKPFRKSWPQFARAQSNDIQIMK